MICTAKPLTRPQSLRTRESNLEQQQPKPKLAARWQKVDGQLICQWIIA